MVLNCDRSYAAILFIAGKCDQCSPNCSCNAVVDSRYPKILYVVVTIAVADRNLNPWLDRLFIYCISLSFEHNFKFLTKIISYTR
jgi:hypothetical protein